MHKIHEKMRLIFRMVVYDLLLIISLPITFIIGNIGLLFGLLALVVLFPVAVYHTYKYREILLGYQDTDACENIQYLIDFYAHHKDCSSRLVMDCVRYVDYIYQGHPQQYVKYRFEFCIFLGKICRVVIEEQMESNHDVFDYVKKKGFENCRDPRKYFGILRVDDIRIFKDSVLL